MADPPYYDPTDPNQQDPNVGLFKVINDNGTEQMKRDVNKHVDSYNRANGGPGAPNAGAYQYGGWQGGAQSYAKTYGDIAANALGNQDQFYGQYNEDRGNAAAARGGQQTTAEMMLARAQGKVPSIAQQQADRQMGQLAAEQTSAAASARGPAGLALAQQNAMNATATGQSAISGQAQINAAMERERAEQAAFGAYSGMRGQDAQQQGLALQGAGQAGGQALGYSSLQHGVNTAQLQAQGNEQGQIAANKFGALNLAEAKKARQDANTNALIGGGASLAMGAMMLSDERAKVPVGYSPGIAPGAPYANPSTYEQSRQAAMRALDDAEMREAHARAYGRTERPLPATYGGVEAIDRYEGEKLALTRAKERHDVPLTEKEKIERVSQEYSEQRQKRPQQPQPKGRSHPEGADKPVGTDKPEQAPKYTDAATQDAIHGGDKGMTDRQKMGMQTIANAGLGMMNKPVPSVGTTYVPPVQQQISSDVRGKTVGEPMWSDMGTKNQMPVYSDDRTKLMAARQEGYDAAISNVTKASMLPPERLVHASGLTSNKDKTAAAIAARDIKARAWDEGAQARQGDAARGALSRAQSATQRAAQKDTGFGTPQTTTDRIANAQASMGAAVYAPSQHAMDKLDEPSAPPAPSTLQTGSAASRIRARASALTTSNGEPRYVPLGASARGDAIDDQAEVYSDERTKNLMSKADREIAKVRTEDERMSKRGPLANARGKRDDDMMRQADAELAKLKAESARRDERNASVVDHGQPDPFARHMRGKQADRALYRDAETGPSVWDKEQPPLGRSLDEYDDDEDDVIARTFRKQAPLARAARAQEGAPYAYKDAFRPPEQAPGEVNVGPMAQNMARDPIASTAVRQDEETGLLSLDRDKMLKMHGAVQAGQQEEIDALHDEIRRLTRAKKGRAA